MGVYIGIEKILTKNNLHYYQVSATSFDGLVFYMVLDAEKKDILFYQTAEFLKPIKIINIILDGDALIDVPGIKPAVAGRVITRAYKALTKNEYPADISWVS